MNSEIKKLHDQLISMHQSLARRLGTTSDLDEAEAILREMEELNFRVMMAGRLLFKETTATIDDGIGSIIAASADVEKAIKSVARVKDLIKTVGQFLGVVDKTLDLIKQL
jgi:hypothetical protein